MPELEDCDDVVADLLMVILPQNRGHYMCIDFHVIALPPFDSCRKDGRATD